MKQSLKLIEKETRQVQTDGFVLECLNGGFSIATEAYGELYAKRAASCLIEPEINDRVLVAGDLNDDLFLIAVLERMNGTQTMIAVEGDLQLCAMKGRMSIASAKGIELVTAGETSLTSSEISLHSQKAGIFFESLSYIGHKVMAQTIVSRFIGETIDTIAGRISQKVKRSYRTVEEIDQVRSNQIDYRAQKNMSLKGQNALITADELVKVEGEQIHLG